MPEQTILTIGHSTRSFEQFLQLLQAYRIGLLADIRSFPGSRRLPHFNKACLEATLATHGINYLHLKDLGGGRPALPHSINTAWPASGFRGYADHMGTEAFKKAAGQLEETALRQPTAFMCAEAPWRSCHRQLLSDHLKAKGWQVVQIINETRSEEHPYTKEARLVNGQLSYHRPDLFN